MRVGDEERPHQGRVSAEGRIDALAHPSSQRQQRITSGGSADNGMAHHDALFRCDRFARHTDGGTRGGHTCADGERCRDGAIRPRGRGRDEGARRGGLRERHSPARAARTRVAAAFVARTARGGDKRTSQQRHRERREPEIIAQPCEGQRKANQGRPGPNEVCQPQPEPCSVCRNRVDEERHAGDREPVDGNGTSGTYEQPAASYGLPAISHQNASDSPIPGPQRPAPARRARRASDRAADPPT